MSSSFGYGGQLVSVENLPAATGRNQTSVIHLRKVVTETGVVERVRKLLSVEDSKSLNQIVKERAWRPVKEQASSVHSTPFAVLSQIMFRSLTTVLHDTLPLRLHLVPNR